MKLLECFMKWVKLNYKEEKLLMSKNGLEIKQKIDENNKIIETLLTPNQFTLNNTIVELLKENQRLQKECSHDFEDGYCIYCYKEEE